MQEVIQSQDGAGSVRLQRTDAFLVPIVLSYVAMAIVTTLGAGVWSWWALSKGQGEAVEAALPFWQSTTFLTGQGVLLGLVVVAGGVLYRKHRARARAVCEIHGALQDLAQGEQCEQALRLAPELGGYAEAWNALIRENQNKLDRQTDLEIQAVTQATHNAKDSLVGACDAMTAGLILIGKQMDITYANGAAKALIGAAQDDVVGKSALSLITDQEVQDAVKSIISGHLRRMVIIQTDHREQSAIGGGAVLRYQIRPGREQEKEAAVIMIDDITQQSNAEEARLSFVAQATHELRTPLTNIRLYIEELLDEENEDPVEQRKAINVISNEATRLESIVSDLLSVSEMEAGALALSAGDVRLDSLFEELESDYQAQAREKHIELRFELPPKYPTIQGDRAKLSVVFQNMLGNALKYTPEGGKVAVRVEAENEQLCVEVSDTGIGISAEDQQQVFEKFYRARDERIRQITGSGLGLSLAREIARLHGGEIDVRSEIDVGSTFILTLPTRKNAA